MELNLKVTSKSISDEVLELIFSFIDDPQDRNSISLVCKQWHRLDNLTRKEVTVAFCYASTPSSLTSRFNNLQGVKLKGKPRAAKFGTLIPGDWGGYAKHWVREIAVRFCYLKAVHLRRMVVSDEDLLTLAKERRHFLQVLKLDTCSGFSTTGLEAITLFCRSLRELTLEESNIRETSGKWLHELALQNSSSLEVLNFSATNLQEVDVADLDTLARNCRSLSSLKVDSVYLNELSGLLSRATALKELGGVVMSGNADGSDGQAGEVISLPKNLTSLVRLTYEGDNGDAYLNALIQPLASGLRKLDLQYAALSVQGHCQLLRHCSNLEVLEVLNDIGDEGLEVVANNCKNLQRLWVEAGDREIQQGYVTHRGLISIAQGCQNLEHIAMYVSGINNAALEAMGKKCPKLKDFRLCLLMDDNFDTGSPLDDGVCALLRGCCDLTRLALYLRPGFLSDKGMSHIGKFGLKLRWALLGMIGETDQGFSWLADGCPKLERLEMRGCKFTEAGISKAVMKMKSLKYIWVQGYMETIQGQDLHEMKRPFWNIEFIPEQRQTGSIEACGNHQYENIGYHDNEPAQFLAYRSLAGKRTDCPERFLCFP